MVCWTFNILARKKTQRNKDSRNLVSPIVTSQSVDLRISTFLRKGRVSKRAKKDFCRDSELMSAVNKKNEWGPFKKHRSNKRCTCSEAPIKRHCSFTGSVDIIKNKQTLSPIVHSVTFFKPRRWQSSLRCFVIAP